MICYTVLNRFYCILSVKLLYNIAVWVDKGDMYMKQKINMM